MIELDRKDLRWAPLEERKQMPAKLVLLRKLHPGIALNETSYERCCFTSGH